MWDRALGRDLAWAVPSQQHSAAKAGPLPVLEPPCCTWRWSAGLVTRRGEGKEAPCADLPLRYRLPVPTGQSVGLVLRAGAEHKAHGPTA